MTMATAICNLRRDDGLDYRSAPERMLVAPDRATHANDEAAFMVLSPPYDVPISLTRIAFTGARHMVLEDCAESFAVLVPVDGASRILIDGERVELTPQRAIVLGREGRAVEWQSDARVLSLRVPRSAVQIHASALLGGARRLAKAALTLDLTRASALRLSLGELVSGDEGQQQSSTMSGDIVAALVAQHGADTAFPASRSISLARACLDRGATEPLSLEELAGRAGVTAITLQRGFKSCFGMTVAAYSQAVRVHGARARLQCGWESRPIARIAQGAGFQSVATFARAYQKLFGETPTQTRVTASRMNNTEHIDRL